MVGNCVSRRRLKLSDFTHALICCRLAVMSTTSTVSDLYNNHVTLNTQFRFNRPMSLLWEMVIALLLVNFAVIWRNTTNWRWRYDFFLCPSLISSVTLHSSCRPTNMRVDIDISLSLLESFLHVRFPTTPLCTSEWRNELRSSIVDSIYDRALYKSTFYLLTCLLS